MNHALRKKLKMLATRHKPNGEANVFIRSLPRSGSTWLMELIATQPGFTWFNEPFNLDKPVVRERLGLSEWKDLHMAGNAARLHAYVSGLCDGSIRDSRYDRPAPFSEFYRPVTCRAVLKMILAGEEHMQTFADACNGRIVLLLRHPIPVSKSRKKFPKLAALLETDFRRFFDATQLALAAQVIAAEDKFAHGMLDWCLHTAVALHCRTASSLVVTYEQLVLDPAPVIRRMAEKLELPAPERMFRRLAVPSLSTGLSTPGTREVLKSVRDATKQEWLVSKWRDEATADEVARASELLEAFRLDHVYRATEVRPGKDWWIV